MRRSLIVGLLCLATALVGGVASARPSEVERNVSARAATDADPPRTPDRGRSTPRRPDRGPDAPPPEPKASRRGRAGKSTDTEGADARPPIARPRGARSRSIGLPFRGRLRNGLLAAESAHLRYTGEYRAAGNFYGTRELVALLERAGARVSQRVPGAKLSIGELSAEHGGDIPGHSSHENGRDADVAFYLLDGRGRPVEPFGFAEVGPDGRARGGSAGLVFDDRRNYELAARLVTDGDARVQYVFVARAVKRRILAEAARRRAPRSILERLETVMVEPAGPHAHRNHFHVRIYCAPADRPRCEDRGPYHRWYPGVLPAVAIPRPMM